MATNHYDLTEGELIIEGLNLVFAARLSSAKVNARRYNYSAARFSLLDAQTVMNALEARCM
jgi:hypothetical protein